MDTRKHVQELLDHLAESLHCGPLVLDNDNQAMMGLFEDMGAVFYLLSNDDHAHGSEADGENGSLICSLVAGRINENDRTLLLDLLCGNYMWNSSGSGSLAVDRESGMLTVQRLVPLPLNKADFIRMFEELTSAALYWRNRLLMDSFEESPLDNMIRV